MDVDPVRSKIMRAVPRTDTTPERCVRQLAHSLGFRFRLHRRDLPGTPDIVFPRLSTVVFVHGCFWHRHPKCTKASTPRTRALFWREKFKANVGRDKRAIARLSALGWRVSVIWECETLHPDRLERKLLRVLAPRAQCTQKRLSRSTRN
ncbi:MAG TPA: very short patch repair endonuclease [Steroidobacteraceae bacterium]|nr:very short patch repair endonuclease [Steroidobacteraceae bacterium]